MTLDWKSGWVGIALLAGSLVTATPATPALAAASAPAATSAASPAAPPVFPLDLPTAGAASMPPRAATIAVAITNLDPARTQPATLTFYFVIPRDSRPGSVVPETGTRSSRDIYDVPVPNYGHAQTVYVESSYRGAGGDLGVTIDGPLFDASGAWLATVPLPTMHSGRFHPIGLHGRFSQ